MEISITRGLAELKLLDKKISKAISDNTFTGVAVGKKSVKGYKTTEEYIEAVKSMYQSIKALIKRRQAIKSAIVKSNATTIVVIAGESMTVAEAIERKSSISYEQELLRKINLDFNIANNKAESENQNIQPRLDKLLEAHFGKDVKSDPAQVKLISDPFLEANEYKVIDPINSRVEVEALQNRIDDFLSEVDFVLSESNTVTKIEIPE